MQARIVELFEEHFGAEPVSVREIGADGSNRTYIRLIGPAEERAIGAIGPDPEENRAFLSFTRTLRGAGFPVPELYETDEAASVWLEEDLGDVTLFAALEEARDREGGTFPESMIPTYRKVLALLPRLQLEGGRIIDFGVAYPRSAFDEQSIRWDLNYFKYHFLKLAHVPFSEQRLENDFDSLTGFLLDTDTGHFLYRDFQSRNIMLREGDPWLIDYQGGRRGALHYDPASLLYDAKAAIPEPLRDELLEHYLDVLAAETTVDRGAFRHRYRGYVVARLLQAMGAYGYRGFHEGKPRFLQSVPHAARNLEVLLDRGLPVSMPELEAVFRRIIDRWAGEEPDDGDELTVRVMSFSYRRGYPRDPDPHGGGFVFDCRGLPNPGRLPAYAHESGLNEGTAAFLDERDETRSFWNGVRQLVDAQVEEYLRRGFTSLAVSFGCTGGQHRSVYMSERLADHLVEAYPQVAVRVTHRESEGWPAEAARPAPERPGRGMAEGRTGDG